MLFTWVLLLKAAAPDFIEKEATHAVSGLGR